MDGLSLRFRWGEQRLHSEVIKPGNRAFTVGAAAGVDFPCAEVAGAERFTLVPQGEPHTVRFARGMNGTLWRGEAGQSLQAAAEAGQAERDGDGWAIELGPRDAVVLELGGIAVEAVPVAVPKPVKTDPLDAIDLRMLNVLAVVVVLCGAAVVSAVTNGSDDEYADDSAPQTKLLVRYLTPPKPAPASAPAVATREKLTPSKAGEAPKQKVVEKASASKGQDPRQIAQQLGQFMSGLFKSGQSDPLGVAIGGLKNAAVAANGNHGLGLKGDADGGGGGELIGLVGIHRPGRGFGPGQSPDGAGILCKAGQSCKAKPSPEVIGTSEVTVIGMDKELIRQVIARHKSEVRYCYELELTKNPSLQGKTAVRFLISGSGAVTASSVVESTVRSDELSRCVEGRVRTWQFPKPPGGGTVTVTYPFVFRATGS